MENEMVNLSINNDVVKNIVNNQMRAAILNGLGGTQKVLEEAIYSLMQMKCNNEGKVSTYSSDNKFYLFDVIFTKELTNVVRECATEWCKQQKDKIKENIKKAFTKQTKIISEKLIKQLIDSVEDTYMMKIDIKFE